MKYRLVELLKCPSHPDLMLRVVRAHISDVFPCSGEYSVPICRSGCGYLSNWFTDIPESLPPSHRFDCRRCMGTEIDSAILTCPECRWFLKIEDGVIQTSLKTGSGEVSTEPEFNRKVSSRLEKTLQLKLGDIIFSLISLPDSLNDSWGSMGVERLQVELSNELLAAGRAKSCADGQGMVHFLGGPLDLAILRPGSLDGIVIQIPTERIADYPDSLGSIPDLLRPSGRAILIVEKSHGEAKSRSQRLEEFKVELPASFSDLTLELVASYGFSLFVAKHPEPENGFSYYRNGSHK